MELTIHEVGHSARYPDGVKYGLLMVDLQTGKRVLMDNHHLHIDETERPYEYRGDVQLIEDFKRFVLDHIGVAI